VLSVSAYYKKREQSELEQFLAAHSTQTVSMGDAIEGKADDLIKETEETAVDTAVDPVEETVAESAAVEEVMPETESVEMAVSEEPVAEQAKDEEKTDEPEVSNGDNEEKPAE
jgi:hypothetical protein